MKDVGKHFLLCGLFLLGFSSTAQADDLTQLLEKGAVARVDVDANGRFDAVVSVVDVAVPAEFLWAVLTDFASYRFFVPRVSEVTVTPSATPGTVEVKWSLDTPLVSTRYKNANVLDAVNRLMTARTVEGDMVGSRYQWQIVVLGDKKCRMFHTAWPRNMNGIVDTLDDKQQTLTIGVAVSTAMATVRALKIRAESLQRSRKSTVVVSPP